MYGRFILFLFFFFVFFFLFIFNQRIIALQYCVGICHTTTWVSHKYTHVPSLLNLLPPPPPHPTSSPSHPSRLSRSTKLGFLCYTAASHCLSVLHVGVYVRQCYSVHSSLPLLPLLGPQVHFLRLCLYFCPTAQQLSLPWSSQTTDDNGNICN